jgi:hypothetical protein
MDLSILIATVPPRKKYLNRLLTNLQKQIVENKLESNIEILIYEDNFETVVGYKFNKLVDSCNGTYCVLIGDDDMISDDYCKTIIDGIKSNPGVDQIAHNHRYYHNNTKKYIPIKVSKEHKGECLVFLKIFNLYVTKYYDNNTDWELKLNAHQFMNTMDFKERALIKVKKDSFKMLFLLCMVRLFHKSLKLNLRYTCHTTPIRKEIFQTVKFTDRTREQDLEWATKIHQLGLIKTECRIDKDLYYYYYDENMSIDRGTSGSMGHSDMEKKRNDVTLSTKDFEWELQPIDKINIQWIS